MDLEQAIELKAILEAKATEGGQPDHEQRYRTLREMALRNHRDHLPQCVRECRMLKDFWGFIKPLDGNLPGNGGVWAGRREYLRREFVPLFTELEKPARLSGDPTFTDDTSAYMSRVVKVLMAAGAAKEVAVLTAATSITFEFYEDNHNLCCDMQVLVPLPIHSRLFGDNPAHNVERSITRAANQLVAQGPEGHLDGTRIGIAVEPSTGWKGDALAWLRGEGINNQGRVRSDNVASRQVDGLLFRSPAEINVYYALKDQGVVVAPLPVFLKGGQTYQRVEPDFIVIRGGATMLLEVDGDTVHVERPSEAEDRVRMFKVEGVYVDRIRASDCDTPERARTRVAKVLADFDRWRASRR